MIRIHRYFHNPEQFSTYGTFIESDGYMITAAHVADDMGGYPDAMNYFESGGILERPNDLDLIVTGDVESFMRRDYMQPYAGMEVILEGFPKGSACLAKRTGRVYIRRDAAAWIVKIEDPNEPVVVGMSGGAVRDAGSGKLIGVITTRNSKMKFPGGTTKQHSCDFAALSDVKKSERTEQMTFFQQQEHKSPVQSVGIMSGVVGLVVMAASAVGLDLTNEAAEQTVLSLAFLASIFGRWRATKSIKL